MTDVVDGLAALNHNCEHRMAPTALLPVTSDNTNTCLVHARAICGTLHLSFLQELEHVHRILHDMLGQALHVHPTVPGFSNAKVVTPRFLS